MARDSFQIILIDPTNDLNYLKQSQDTIQQSLQSPIQEQTNSFPHLVYFSLMVLPLISL